MDRANYRCEICGADGVLECYERWFYDDINHVQKLVGYEIVCPSCLSILRIERTMQVGGLERALSHFIRITGFTEDDLRTATEKALTTWRERSRYEWRVDVTSEPLVSSVKAAPPPRARGPAPRPSSRPASRMAAPTKKPLPTQTSFSQSEISFLKTQRLARIATASSRGVPEVSPVGFEFDGRFFWIGSHDQSIFFRTQRYRNIKAGNSRISLVIDDLKSVDPWRPRGLKVSGTAEITDHDGIFGKGKYFRITPRVSVSWGIEEPKMGRWSSRKKFA